MTTSRIRHAVTNPKPNQKGIGARHHSAKMTAAKVRQARKSFATGKWTISALAVKYGISNTSMAAIVHGRSWKHL